MISHAAEEVRLGQDLEATFYRFYDREFDTVMRYLRAALPDPGASEDICAESFCRAWTAWRRFHGDQRAERAWVMRIARNLMIDHLRRQRRTPTVPIDAHDPVDEASRHGVEAVLLRHALQGLEREDRDLLAMRMAGLAHSEIAHLSGRSEAAVKKAWQRALGRVRVQLEGSR